jgi:CHAD domain-containing protein
VNQIDPHEPVANSVRRIVGEEIAAAEQRLGSPEDRDETIHEVRKSVKKVRGVLRLMQPVLNGTYQREVDAWREIAHRLAGLRDAGAVIGAFDEICETCPQKVGPAIRQQLLAKKRELEKKEDVSRVFSLVGTDLKRAERRVRRWNPAGEGFSAIAPGLRKTFKKGNEALRTASAEPSPENLHDLRKRVKEQLYQLRLLEALWDTRLRRQEKRLGKLEDTLGRHHNVVVLRSKIAPQPTPEVAAFLKYAGEFEADLAKRALKMAKRVYRDSAGKFTRRVERLWNAA